MTGKVGSDEKGEAWVIKEGTTGFRMERGRGCEGGGGREGGRLWREKER